WKACDTLRGTIDPTQYKDYILVLLFLKYVSDLVRDQRERYLAEYDGDEKRVERAMSRERFQLPAGADFYTLYAARKTPLNEDGEPCNIGELINKALIAIEDENRAKLEGVFRNIDFNSAANLGDPKVRSAKLQHLLEDFADPRLDLRPSHLESQDVLGDAYEYLVSNFASDSGKKGGEFYTPAEVSKLLARLLGAQPGERVCDPCCGSGSLLIRACGEVPADDSGTRNVKPFGQELNGATWALCKMNMFLHGLDSARIERGDTIRAPQLVEGDRLMTFDVVIANPPFSLAKWGHEDVGDDAYKRFHRGLPPKSRGDWAFISHMLETVDRTTGRVGVVVPHGVLFRGSKEKQIRQATIEENLLDGVIGLPANLFFGVGIPAALLLFRRGRAEDDGVFFIDASAEFEKGKNQNRLRTEDIEKIVATWQARENVERYATLVNRDEIRENDFNLNIPLYVDTFVEEEPVDLEAVRAEIARLEEELKTSRTELNAALRELEL
ncbi:MAG: type I restriction-modification system subunit M, partial [Bacteroidota bacterium]